MTNEEMPSLPAWTRGLDLDLLSGAEMEQAREAWCQAHPSAGACAVCGLYYVMGEATFVCAAAGCTHVLCRQHAQSCWVCMQYICDCHSVHAPDKSLLEQVFLQLGHDGDIPLCAACLDKLRDELHEGGYRLPALDTGHCWSEAVWEVDADAIDAEAFPLDLVEVRNDE